MSIGKRIRAYRKAAGLTQKQLAAESGIAEITLRQYENEKRIPNSDKLKSIATSLKISPSLLMDVDISLLDNQYKAFENYLNSLGYLINSVSIPVTLNKADIIDQIPEYAKEWHNGQEFIEMETVSYELIKDNEKIILEENDYSQLQEDIKDFIEFKFWKNTNK